MASTGSKLSFGITYGFLGGHLVSRRLRRLMKAGGFDHCADLNDADIVIAHSAGCWEAGDLKPRLLVMVGLPMAKPGLPTSFRANRARTSTYLANRHIPQGLSMTGFNLYYGLRQPRRNLKIIRNAKGLQVTATKPEEIPVLFIINRNDPWTQNPDELQNCLQNKDWVFLGLPGSHDDIWEHPSRYVEIIERHARLLA